MLRERLGVIEVSCYYYYRAPMLTAIFLYQFAHNTFKDIKSEQHSVCCDYVPYRMDSDGASVYYDPPRGQHSNIDVSAVHILTSTCHMRLTSCLELWDPRDNHGYLSFRSFRVVCNNVRDMEADSLVQQRPSTARK